MKESSLESSLEDSFLLIRLKGYFDGNAGTAVKKEFEERFSAGVTRCLFDFSQVTIINSPGITFLMEFSESLAYERRIPLGCFGIAEMYIEIFEAIGLLQMIQIFPDEPTGRKLL
jgi:anti-anti-sigma regulatory factor